MKYDFRVKQFTETATHPNKLAIVGSEISIDWSTLKQKAEELAIILNSLKIPNGYPIIIYGHKEHLFPLAILACIHSNTTYIPIDKIYPAERIKKIIALTGAQLLINCSGNLPQVEVPIIIDRDLNVIVNNAAEFNGRVYANASDPLQYIMFTSGSTGEPKGVQITLSSVLTFIEWANSAFGFCTEDVFMNQAPFTFDVSLCDVLNAFSNGATLVLTPTALIKDQQAFFKLLTDHKCSVWTSTPSFAYLFLRHPGFNSTAIPTIKTFLFMGEELPNRTAAQLKITFPDTRILNAYGPTEATIVTTLVEITDEIIKKHPSLPIGYPMPGAQLLINKTTQEDKAGELVIVGNHVSTGYFNNTALNDHKFFIHEGKRAFNTGDLAYYENGLLFFLGRNDDQVKMHGFRIELNEITHVISQHELISEAITIALKRNKEVKKIIAFVILKTTVKKEELMTEMIPFLESKIPYYMIPGDIAVVDQFPYNTSFKIDKNQLIDDYLKKQFNGV